jgi:hypothetical protein
MEFGGVMVQGKMRSRVSVRQLPLLALVLGLPALSMTTGKTTDSPAPSESQCALIEVHDTAGIGWWSPATLDIGPPPYEDRGG